MSVVNAIRNFILVLSICILVIRIPVLFRHRQNRLFWITLFANIIVAVIIQQQFGYFIDSEYRIPDLKAYLSVIYGVVCLAINVRLAHYLSGKDAFQLWRIPLDVLVAFFVCVILGILVFFIPNQERMYGSTHSVADIILACLSALYLCVASIYAGVILLHLPQSMSRSSLKVSIVLLMAGLFLWTPFTVIRLIERINTYTPPFYHVISTSVSCAGIICTFLGCGTVPLVDMVRYIFFYFLKLGLRTPWVYVRNFNQENLISVSPGKFKDLISYRHPYEVFLERCHELRDICYMIQKDIDKQLSFLIAEGDISMTGIAAIEVLRKTLHEAYRERRALGDVLYFRRLYKRLARVERF